MFRNPIFLTVLGLVLLGVGVYFLFFGDEDAAIINRNLDRIVELAEKEGDESFFVVVAAAREIAGFFAEEMQIDLGPPLPVVNDRNELQSLIVQARQSAQTVAIRIVRNNLTVADDGLSARMNLEVDGQVTLGGESGRERREFLVEWIKSDGEWMIRNVEMEGRLHGLEF